MYSNMKQLERRYGKVRSTIIRWVKKGRLPRPHKPGGTPKSHCLWRESELLAAEAKW